MDRKYAYDYISSLRSQLSEKIIGQDRAIDLILTCLLSGGHLLITGLPGLGKTRMVRALAHYLGISFGRIQYTPDLLPSDISGSEILEQDSYSTNMTMNRRFKFVKGPIFNNLVLADEINRASPRTQSAMLEAMQEKSLTYGSHSYDLPKPFMVCATQNPIESEGTYPLPEAQLDRFLMSITIDYPDQDSELELLKAFDQQVISDDDLNTNFHHQKHLTNQQLLMSIIDLVKKIKIDDDMLEVINDLVRSTRNSSDDRKPQDQAVNDNSNFSNSSKSALFGYAKSKFNKKHQDADQSPKVYDNKLSTDNFKIRYGAGPRAAISLLGASKAFAFLDGQEYVRWRHIKALSYPVLCHRIGLSSFGLSEKTKHHKDFIDYLVKEIENKQNLLLGEK